MKWPPSYHGTSSCDEDYLPKDIAMFSFITSRIRNKITALPVGIV